MGFPMQQRELSAIAAPRGNQLILLVNQRIFWAIIFALQRPNKGKSALMKRLSAIGLSLGLAVLAPGIAQAAEGNPATARDKVSMCIGCHGIPGYKTAFPVTYNVPKLGGQHAAYIVKALQGYKNGDRTHPSMRAIAAGLSDKDMADVAAYYAAPAMQAASK